MIHKKSAFTLAEALILLLIAALIAAAFVPVITRKHREVDAHGKWICTLNDKGEHVIETVINGKKSGFKTSSPTTYCTFTPPANVKEFTLKAVGGGGGGAGGSTGTEEILYDSASDGDVFAHSVKQSGSYLIVARAGGGAGGGIGCGEADNYRPSITFNFKQNKCSYYDKDSTWNETTQSHSNAEWGGCNITTPNGETSKYGYVDTEEPAWKAANNYEKLYQNDAALTDKYKGVSNTSIYDPAFKYKHIKDTTLQNRVLCFAESNWPFSILNKGINVDKCWNFPGEGGKRGQDGRKAGDEMANSVELAAGQSIYISVGAGGVPTTDNYTQERIKTFHTPGGTFNNVDVPIGGNGGNGGNTIVDYGTGSQVLLGGRGGYSRIRQKIIYKDIPVYECPVVKTTGTFDNYSNRYACVGLSQSSCANKKGCVVNTHQTRDYLGCSGGGTCTGKSEYSCYGSWSEEITKEDGSKETVTHNCTKSYSDYYSVYDGCSVGKHSGIDYKVDTENCVRKVRPEYDFGIYGCAYTTKPTLVKSNYNEADYPELVPTITLKGQKDSSHADSEPVAFDTGKSGSGGYGLGNFAHNYLQSVPNDSGGVESVLSFAGQYGTKGEATVFKVSYTGGGGGQAGAYINTMYKKLDKLKITIGKGGYSSSSNSRTDGSKGGNTKIMNENGSELFTVSGGAGGKHDAVINNATLDHHMIGGDGAPSPMESLDDKAKVIPYGGKSNTNGSLHGMTPKTEVWKTENNLKSLLGLTFGAFQFTGGNPLDITYGAGGGGGAGSRAQGGNGGVGAPGAVIIEW